LLIVATIAAFHPVNAAAAWLWPDRYFVPGEVRGYCTIGAPSRVGGDGAMVSGAGGL
jgi:hypothetical protein